MTFKYQFGKKNTEVQSLIPHSIYLFSEKCKFNPLPLIQRNFTITTNDSSCQFNTIILENTSDLISEFIKENPNQFFYHLDINDKDSYLQILERIYQGEFIKLKEEEFSYLQSIAEKLHVIEFPKSFPETFGFCQTLNLAKIRFILRESKIKINESTIYSFCCSKQYETFSIHTNKKEYKCNIFGVHSSSIIHEFLVKNPESDFYYFDIDDDNGEFESIANIFNFKTVELTVRNIDFIKDFAEELGIDFIFNNIDEFLNSNEKTSKVIDDQQVLIDSIDEMFDLLYNIEENGVESVSISIIESEWSQKEEKTYELAAFILNVALTSIKLGRHMTELLYKLNENDKNNYLCLLVPFIVKRLMVLFSEKVKTRNYDLIFPFIYHMYKKELIPKETLDDKLKKCSLDNSFFVSWFLPEIIELNENKSKVEYIEKNAFFTSTDENKSKVDNIKKNAFFTPTFGKFQYKTKFSLISDASSLYFFHIANNIEDYKEMRDKGENNDEIARALREDDVDKFQSIISKDVEKLIKKRINRNMFEPFIEKNISYLNYDASYGSIKCFKYIMLNNQQIDQSTFEMAVIGGNDELIRIADNKIINNPTQINIIKRCLIHTIQMHRNDLFDWIFEQKFDIINEKENLYSLMICSIKNGNAHTLVQIIDNGFNFDNYSIKKKPTFTFNLNNNFSEKYHEFIEIASINGFYSLLIFLTNLINKDNDKKMKIDAIFTTSLDNIFIFKLFEEDMSEQNLHEALIAAINSDSFNIIHYFFDTIINDKLILNQDNITNILINGIDNSSKEVLNYLIDKINQLYPINQNLLYSILNSSKKRDNYEEYKQISELIYKKNPQSDFTEISILVVKLNITELLKFFIDQKYQINYVELAESIFDNNSIDIEILSLIMNELDSIDRKRIINYIDKSSLRKDKSLITYLIKENVSIEDSFFYAVNNNNIELVEMILEKNKDPSLINKITCNGTPLTIAAQKNYIEIAKKLLSLPGIDPNIYYGKFMTPLIISAILI